MKNVIVLCGSKCSGKTTAATAIYGYHLVQQGVIPNANFDANGRMSIVFNKEKQEGIYFDIDSNDLDFLEYKSVYVDKYINHVGFADELKYTAANLFGLDYNKLIGTNDEKNEVTHIKWADMNKLLPKKKQKTSNEFMTNREFLEVFGTDICRTIMNNCHVSAAYKNLQKLNPDIGLITDCRFENEFTFFENIDNAILIRLLRNPYNSTVASEVGLKNISLDRYHLVIPEDKTLAEKNQIIIDYLIKNNVLDKINITKVN